MTSIASEFASPLAARIDAIERAFEFMLGYATQDRQHETEGKPAPIRDYLRLANQTLAELEKTTFADLGAGARDRAACETFLAILNDDARRAREPIQLALAQPRISSRLVDNINSTIHMRAVLTDLFLLDEAVKPAA